MTQQHNSTRRSVSQQWLLALIDEQITEHAAGPLTVVDLGGGAGANAVHFAEHGHTVTVIDPSPDQLANTQRRARERDVTARITTLQGDTGTLTDLVPHHSVDLVLCHLVFGDVTDRPATLANIADVLRPGGLTSLLVRQPYQRVMRQAMDGDIAAANALLDDNRWIGRRELSGLLADAGFTILAEHGVGAIADMVRADVPAADLLELERRVAGRREWLDAASALHVLARAAA